MIYGPVLVAFVSACIGASLSELASAMPNSGGQYYWTSQIAPRKYAPLLAYLTGGLNWAGSIFASSSVTLSLGSSMVGLYALGHPGLWVVLASFLTYHSNRAYASVMSPWMTFLAYQLVNIFSLLFNFFHGLLPAVSLFSLYISIIGCVVTITIVPTMSERKQPASLVFATFINQTGWSNNAIAFIVGLISPAWYVLRLGYISGRHYWNIEFNYPGASALWM